MSPVKNSGVPGSAAASPCRALASARTAESLIAFVPWTTFAGLCVFSTQIVPTPVVEVNRTSGIDTIGPPYRIGT